VPVISYQMRYASIVVMALILFIGIVAIDVIDPLVGVGIVLMDFLLATMIILSPGPQTQAAEVAYEKAHPDFQPE
jgi:hypothetical protein